MSASRRPVVVLLFSYVAPNMFSGSVLDLEPDTEYEIRLVLSDPDGVKGETQKLVTARTRKEPQPASGGTVYHVYPVGHEGPRQEPSFTGLMAAYYLTQSGTPDRPIAIKAAGERPPGPPPAPR